MSEKIIEVIPDSKNIPITDDVLEDIAEEIENKVGIGSRGKVQIVTPETQKRRAERREDDKGAVKGNIVEAGDVTDIHGDTMSLCAVVQFASVEALKKALDGSEIQPENHLGGAENDAGN